MSDFIKYLDEPRVVGAVHVNKPLTVILVAKTIGVSPIAALAGNVKLLKVKFCSVIVANVVLEKA